jgi:hypothetical protein
VDKGFDKLNNEIKKLGDKMDKQFTNLHGVRSEILSLGEVTN